MAFYVRKKGGNLWHWCKNCSQYPSIADKTEGRGSRPVDSEVLCEECRGLTDKGECRPDKPKSLAGEQRP